MKRYRLSVCKGSDCRANGSDAVYARATAETRGTELGKRCEVTRGGCYGLCHLGPNVVVREDLGAPVDPFSSEDYQLTYAPGETYYWRMTPEKLVQVLTRHVLADEKVEALVGDPSLEKDFRKRE